jgi:small conductance mechanosensitive channel
MALVGAAALFQAPDPQVAACGPENQQAWLCSAVYRISGNQNAAEVADSLATPLQILVVLLLVFIAIRIVRHLLRRAADRASRTERIDALRVRTGLAPLSPTEHRRRDQRVHTLSGVAANVAAIGLWLVAALVIIGEFGIDLGPLLAGAGVITVVIGFGAQTAVRDYLAGTFMLLEDQFGVGDVVDLGEAVGTVEWVSLRVTRLRDVEGVVWWVPNGEIKRLGNKAQGWSRALLDVGVSYETDPERAGEIIKRAADELWRDPSWSERVLSEPELWGVEALGPDSVVIRLVVQTAPLEQWTVARELRLRIKRALDAAGIDIPFPQRSVVLRAEGPTGDADPPRESTDPA